MLIKRKKLKEKLIEMLSIAIERENFRIEFRKNNWDIFSPSIMLYISTRDEIIFDFTTWEIDTINELELNRAIEKLKNIEFKTNKKRR